MFNTPTTAVPTMPIMHPQMARLYEAAAELKGVRGQSAVARLLNMSPQAVKNWEARGVSYEGAIGAQKIIGCNAVWVLENIGNMRLQDQPIVDNPNADRLRELSNDAIELAVMLDKFTTPENRIEAYGRALRAILGPPPGQTDAHPSGETQLAHTTGARSTARTTRKPPA